MGRWTKGYAIEDTFDAVDAHNADCEAYEAKIAELERRDDIVSRERAAAEIRCAELESRLARIAALVKPVPVADLVEAGTEAPKLLAERQAAIRAILEDESNE